MLRVALSDPAGATLNAAGASAGPTACLDPSAILSAASVREGRKLHASAAGRFSVHCAGAA